MNKEVKLTKNILGMIRLSDIRSTYTGQRGACCCGCKGTHRYASAHASEASSGRGYTVGQDEISARSVKTIFNKIKRYFDEETSDAYMTSSPGFGTHLAMFHGSRTWVVYLTKNSGMIV